MIERILKLLRDNDMTAKELTEKLGINNSTVSEWKKGKTKPSVEHIRKISEIFHVSTDYIINGKSEYSRITCDSQSELDYTMLDVFMRLTSSHRAAVRDFFYLCMQEMEQGGCSLEKSSELRKMQLMYKDSMSAQPQEAVKPDDTQTQADNAAYNELNKYLYGG